MLVLFLWVAYLALRLSMQNGIIVVAPPVVTRAYQELSRGIVNLQNARLLTDCSRRHGHLSKLALLVYHLVIDAALLNARKDRGLSLPISLCTSERPDCMVLQIEAYTRCNSTPKTGHR